MSEEKAAKDSKPDNAALDPHTLMSLLKEKAKDLRKT